MDMRIDLAVLTSSSPQRCERSFVYATAHQGRSVLAAMGVGNYGGEVQMESF